MLRVEPEIKAAYVAGGQVRLAFSHMLDHGDASRLAHVAAECAGAQSPLAFWQMHDLLFERQSDIWRGDAALMVTWGGELGLDTETMRACMDDPAVAAKVERLDEERRADGIRARPSFDLNGRLIQGGIPYATFVQEIAEILDQ